MSISALVQQSSISPCSVRFMVSMSPVNKIRWSHHTAAVKTWGKMRKLKIFTRIHLSHIQLALLEPVRKLQTYDTEVPEIGDDRGISGNPVAKRSRRSGGDSEVREMLIGVSRIASL